MNVLLYHVWISGDDYVNVWATCRSEATKLVQAEYPDVEYSRPNKAECPTAHPYDDAIATLGEVDSQHLARFQAGKCRLW